jgi:DNA-directed RNA polymerase subunit RPC12/RpoP
MLGFNIPLLRKGLFLLAAAVLAGDRPVQAPTNRPAQTQGRATTAASAGPVPARQALDSIYVRLLERTNQQLSLWWNPYGVMVAVLAALFAVLAIVAAFIIFRQSREYRSLITSSIVEYQGILNAFIKEKNHEVEVMSKQVSGAIERATKELATATGAQKIEIQKEITALKEFKETLKPREQPAFGLPASDFSAIGIAPGLQYSTAFTPGLGGWRLTAAGLTRSHTCVKCSKQYDPPAPDKSSFMTIGGRPVTCPHCGNVERILS